MRYPASEKLEIIRTVEASHLPVKQTLKMLVAFLAIDFIPARAAGDHVIAGAAINNVVARAGVDRIVAAVAFDEVVGAASMTSPPPSVGALASL